LRYFRSQGKSMSSPRGRKATERAFTLIEVLVGTTILGVGVVGILTTVSLSLKASGEGFRLREAVRLSERVLEETLAGSDGISSAGEEGIYKWNVAQRGSFHETVLTAVTCTWDKELARNGQSQVTLPTAKPGQNTGSTVRGWG